MPHGRRHPENRRRKGSPPASVPIRWGLAAVAAAVAKGADPGDRTAADSGLLQSVVPATRDWNGTEPEPRSGVRFGHHASFHHSNTATWPAA